MNRLIAAGAVVALFATASVSAFADQAVSRQLSWNGAPSLDIAVPARITYTQAPTVRMVVSGPKEAVDKVYIDGEHLRYRRTSWWWGDNSPRNLRVEISSPHLTNLGVHSGGSMTIPSIREDALTVRVHSGARLDMNVSVRALSASVHSGAALHGAGRAERLGLKVHSGAGANLADLQVDHADVDVHSGASATVNARLSAEASAHSGASVRLVGRPQQLSMDRHSGGSIRVN